MAARVETKFTADTRDIERRLAQLDTRMDKFANRAANSMSAVQRNVNNLDQSTARLGRTLTTMAGTFAAAFSIQQAVALADTFTQFEAKLINANVAAGDMAKTQEKLFAIAKANGSEIVALADLYGAMSMSAQSLGLSQADIMTATEGVSAAMRVSGATTAQTSATILQLGQALAGGTVRAEEYNSMLENSPALVRAVADASTKWGGDLGKLRKEINDGKVSSQEWAQAILAASDVLVSKAAKAPLTVAASLQNLRTSMVEYIGQADASLGATDKLSFALKLLGENIDTVAGAIAIVGSVIVSRGVGSLAAYTGSAIAAQVATARLTMFQATMTASMTGVSRSALMATTAMTGLNASMAFLGGPIGIAITAIAVAVMGLSSAAKTAQRETGEFTDAISESNRVLKEASEINRSVADMTKSFGSESAGAVAGVLGLCDATGKLADETFRLADAQQEAARTAILDRIAKNRVEIAERENPGFWTKVGEAAGMKYTEGPNRGRYAGDVRKEEARVLESQNTDLMAAAIQMGVGPVAPPLRKKPVVVGRAARLLRMSPVRLPMSVVSMKGRSHRSRPIFSAPLRLAMTSRFNASIGNATTTFARSNASKLTNRSRMPQPSRRRRPLRPLTPNRSSWRTRTAPAPLRKPASVRWLNRRNTKTTSRAFSTPTIRPTV